MENGRQQIADLPWFQKSKKLAIADVVYVEGIGICSHQPDDCIYQSENSHRMMDGEGNIHVVNTSRLFTATLEERKEYWRAHDLRRSAARWGNDQ